MNGMNILRAVIAVLKKPAGLIMITAAIVVTLLTTLVYSYFSYTLRTQAYIPTPLTAPVPTLPPSTTGTSSQTNRPDILPLQDPTQIQGIDVSISTSADKEYPGIYWFRLSYPTCGWGDLKGQKLKNTLQNYHRKGLRVLLVVCQAKNVDSLDWNGIAQAHADAVQCGNEEMKQDPSVAFLYTPPAQFARFYDRCERSIHAVNPQTPVLVGSLDPHVAGPDYQLMVGQVNYLDQMQQAMNTSVRPGSGWNWHTQTLGLIDSWYNGYRGVNNLLGVFDFWAQQFHVDVNSGQLGKHLWVVEGTACYKGCGINQNDPTEVAIVHILTLITDIDTSLRAHVPFFHFSGNDIPMPEGVAPLGVGDINGHPKPLRQDKPMGAYKLTLTCPGNVQVTVIDQLQLMVRLYARCTLPANYFTILTS
jgi:hypothetical protein